MRIYKLILLLCFFSITISLNAQNTFANTLSLTDSVSSPKASFKDISWIQGHWRGKAFGGITEEVWSPPLGGSMMCMFKLVVNNKVSFYELVTLTEENNTLMLRLKHFHGNLKGWEEKDKTIDFRLVRVTENKIYFDKFTFERVSDTEMNIYVVISNKGKEDEIKFTYQKVKE